MDKLSITIEGTEWCSVDEIIRFRQLQHNFIYIVYHYDTYDFDQLSIYALTVDRRHCMTSD
jgi:hypothetical protein